jgi:hypothetical protein
MVVFVCDRGPPATPSKTRIPDPVLLFLVLEYLMLLGGLVACWLPRGLPITLLHTLEYGHLDRTSDYPTQGVRAPSTPRPVTLRSSRSDLRALAHQQNSDLLEYLPRGISFLSRSAFNVISSTLFFLGTNPKYLYGVTMPDEHASVFKMVIYTPRGQGTNLLKLSTGQKLDVLRLC